MTETEFWKLIDDYVDRSDVTELDVTALEGTLRNLLPERIEAFGHHFDRFHLGSYRNCLWGAAYLINGGCSDDGFDYFRGWLIGMGRDVYEKAMADPDSLVDVAEDDMECEDLLYAASRAYEAATGKEISLAPDAIDPVEDDDWDFDDNNEMRKRFPRLFAKFSS